MRGGCMVGLYSVAACHASEGVYGEGGVTVRGVQ